MSVCKSCFVYVSTGLCRQVGRVVRGAMLIHQGFKGTSACCEVECALQGLRAVNQGFMRVSWGMASERSFTRLVRHELLQNARAGFGPRYMKHGLRGWFSMVLKTGCHGWTKISSNDCIA